MPVYQRRASCLATGVAWVGSVVLLTASLAVLLGGAWQACRQHEWIASARPVEAEVLAKRVERRGADVDRPGERRKPWYAPVVEYRYEAAGRARRANRVFPGMPPMAVLLSTRPDAARRVIEPFEVGEFEVVQTVTAYHLPDRPGESFLLRRYGFFPQATMMAGAVLLAAIGSAVYTVRTGGKGSPRLAGRAILLLWGAVGLAVHATYFAVTDAADDPWAVPTTLIFAVLGLLPLGLALPSIGPLGAVRRAVFGAFVGCVAGLVSGAVAGAGLRAISGLVVGRERAVGDPVWAFHAAASVGLLFAVLGAIAREEPDADETR